VWRGAWTGAKVAVQAGRPSPACRWGRRTGCALRLAASRAASNGSTGHPHLSPSTSDQIPISARSPSRWRRHPRAWAQLRHDPPSARAQDRARSQLTWASRGACWP
jgi:hypothetical protein